MHWFWRDLLDNGILWVTVLSWSIAQFIKIIIGVIREKRFNFKWIFGTGGMPSSHAAGVSTLATAIGLTAGFDSYLFALAAIFAFITMFDAQTSRRSIGVQARILNRIMDDLSHNKGVEEHKLRELIGHTPIEVLVGCLLGIGIALALGSRLL